VILYDKFSKPNEIEPSTNGQVQSLLNSAVLRGISEPVDLLWSNHTPVQHNWESAICKSK
jgi:hypothetical protein